MPVVLRAGGLRFYFFSNEGWPREPPHIHVRGGGGDAKVWLSPRIELADSYGFNPADLARILRIATDNCDLLLDAWHDHFGD